MPETEDLTEVEQSAIFNAFARTTGTNNVSPLLAAVHDIVAAREAAARREALLEAAEESEMRINLANRVTFLEAKVARAIEWARVEAGELGAEDLRAALAEPERDEESGR